MQSCLYWQVDILISIYFKGSKSCRTYCFRQVTEHMCSDFLLWWEKNLFSSTHVYWVTPEWRALWGAEVDSPFLLGSSLASRTIPQQTLRLWHGFILRYRWGKASQRKEVTFKPYLKDREVEGNESRTYWFFYSYLPALEQGVGPNWRHF